MELNSIIWKKPSLPESKVKHKKTCLTNGQTGFMKYGLDSLIRASFLIPFHFFDSFSRPIALLIYV
jgi:hypothetical protein